MQNYESSCFNCRLVCFQILKICLNHRITHALSLHPMENSEGKAWSWVATDFAEGTESVEKLAVR